MTRVEEIREKTAGRNFEEILPVKRRNAVLIPLVEVDGELRILFEVRQTGIRQGGEICFPGGGIEARETAEEAAVRETAEELLIPRENIEVIAPMHVMSGPGGAMISSCLGIVHDYEGSYSKKEVDHVFTVPLSWFAANEPRISSGAMAVETAEDFPYELLPGGRDYPWRKIPRRFYFYESEGGVIWGITAQLLYHALKVLLGKHACSRPESGESVSAEPVECDACSRPETGESVSAEPEERDTAGSPASAERNGAEQRNGADQKNRVPDWREGKTPVTGGILIAGGGKALS